MSHPDAQQLLKEALDDLRGLSYCGTKDDKSVAAFSKLHMAVVRLDNSVDEEEGRGALDAIESKESVLQFLVDFSKFKRLHAKRVAETAGILLSRPRFSSVATAEALDLGKGHDRKPATDSGKTVSSAASAAAPAAAASRAAAAPASPVAAAAQAPARASNELVEHALYANTKSVELSRDVTDLVNALVKKNPHSDFTRGEPLEAAFGELGDAGDSKKLVVTVGVNMQEFANKTWLGYPNKAFDLTQLVTKAPEVFRWEGVQKGDRLPELRVVPVGNGYVGKNRSNEAGTLSMEGGIVAGVLCHRGGMATSGYVLVVRRDVEVSWAPILRNQPIPSGAVYAGSTSTDGDVYVGKKGAEVGKLNMDKGLMWNIWLHDYGPSDSGDVLVLKA